jgi:hypothetical protein
MRRTLLWMALGGAGGLLQVPACIPQDPAVVQFQVLTLLRSLAVDFLGYGLIRPFN